MPVLPDNFSKLTVPCRLLRTRRPRRLTRLRTPPTRTTIGYVMNHMHTGLTTDRRFTNLATAITTSL
jgi:hypothetical protein